MCGPPGLPTINTVCVLCRARTESAEPLGARTDDDHVEKRELVQVCRLPRLGRSWSRPITPSRSGDQLLHRLNLTCTSNCGPCVAHRRRLQRATLCRGDDFKSSDRSPWSLPPSCAAVDSPPRAPPRVARAPAARLARQWTPCAARPSRSPAHSKQASK